MQRKHKTGKERTSKLDATGVANFTIGRVSFQSREDLFLGVRPVGRADGRVRND